MEVWPFLKQTEKATVSALEEGKGCNTTDDVNLRWISFHFFRGLFKISTKIPRSTQDSQDLCLNCRSYASFALIDIGGPENIGTRNWIRVSCVSCASLSQVFFRDEDGSTRLGDAVPKEMVLIADQHRIPRLWPIP